MYNVRKVTEDIVWVGASDRRLALFENIFPIYVHYNIRIEIKVLTNIVKNIYNLYID